MSGLEVIIICAGIVGGLASAISNFVHWRTAKKSRRDIKLIKEHTRPRIVISNSGVLTPLPTPINEIDTEMQEISDVFPRYEKQELFYDRQTGQYFETIPQQQQDAPPHPF